MTWLIKILWRQSHAIGPIPSLLCAITWLAGGGVMIRFGVGALWQYEAFAWAYIIFVSLVVAFGALGSFWILLDHFRFRSCGYQIRWVAGDDWIYEERIADGSVERLPFSRKTVGDGYPAPCDVYIQSEKNWEQQAPEWARGRRTQIMERIAECSGSDIGGHVQFIDLT